MKILLLLVVIMMSGLLYGLYKYDLGKKNYKLLFKCFPSSMIWPKDVDSYDKFCKIIVFVSTAIFIYFFITW